jgi:hypothetical protein
MNTDLIETFDRLQALANRVSVQYEAKNLNKTALHELLSAAAFVRFALQRANTNYVSLPRCTTRANQKRCTKHAGHPWDHSYDPA